MHYVMCPHKMTDHITLDTDRLTCSQKIYLVQYVPPASTSANLLPKEKSNKAGPDDCKIVAAKEILRAPRMVT